MKWTNTPDTHLLESYCEGKDGKNLGWVNGLFDIDYNESYEALVCNGYEAATLLGHYKTPRLAQMAVERELLKRRFRYEWDFYTSKSAALWVNGTYLFEVVSEPKQRPATLARAKREFLEQL